MTSGPTWKGRCLLSAKQETASHASKADGKRTAKLQAHTTWVNPVCWDSGIHFEMPEPCHCFPVTIYYVTRHKH